MKYQFTSDLLTNNGIIDSEHKSLIEAVNNLSENISKGTGKDNVDKAVTFLLDYTKKHFGHEEELQEKAKYPAMSGHKIWHKSFISELNILSQKIIKSGADSVAVIELSRIASKLINHIKTEDKKLAIFLSAS